MTIGYLLLIGSLIGFGSLGIFHKVADHPSCRPRIITMLLLAWGAVLTGIYTAVVDKHGLHVPGKVLGMGAAAGTMASLALFAFQASLRYGKISTSWLVLNLCVAVPILLSIVVYGEKVTAGKGVGVGMVFAAIFLLWWDKKTDLEHSGKDRGGGAAVEVPVAAPVTGDTDVQETTAAVAVAEPATATPATAPSKSKWLLLIMLAFLANGLAASSQKVLVELGGGDYAWQFYVVLYAAGGAVMAVANALREGWPNRRELVTAVAMAAASVTGNICIVKALDAHVPGSVAYPVANGGSLFLVVLAGVLGFKERVNPAGIAGIVVGIAAVLVLVMS